ncbi:MAG TPA: HEAT repeat domain-containing protein [Gemmataceae bacterium]
MNGCPCETSASFPSAHAPAVRCGVCLLLLLVYPISTAYAEPPQRDPDLDFAERTLRSAKVATDGPDVLAFIRSRTLTPEQLKRLADKVRQLGAADFRDREKAMRELIAIGRPALSHLKQGLNDPDLEIARRARRCIDKIRRNPSGYLMVAAAQVVKVRRPPGAAAVLLDYLPCVDDEALEDTWLDALRAVGWNDEKPDAAVLSALTDRRPAFRAAAAHVLGRGASDEVRDRVAPLLADADPRVRFEAAAARGYFGDRKAVPVLTALLTDAPLPLACRSEYLLCLLAGGHGPAETLDKDEAGPRRRCRDAWETWWREHGERVDWNRWKREQPQLGLTVVCEYDGPDGSGHVREWGQSGEPCWELSGLDGPNDIQLLPVGRALVAERHANRVTERDRRGKIVWEHRAAGVVIGCQRLPNGNTLIVTFRELYEVTRDQKKVFLHRDRMEFRHARKLPNGHILYIRSNGRLVEMDGACRQEIRVIAPAEYADGAKYWASVEPLPNGRYLLALAGSNRVLEIDSAGKILWECTVTAPTSATRLRNGHTLIACFDDRCLIEVDRAGKEVSKQTLGGKPFVVRRH